MDDQQQGAWRSGHRHALPTSPPPRRRLSELGDKRVTLTLHWHKTSGNPLAAIRKSAPATSPTPVYSQPCSATCGSRQEDTASVATRISRLGYPHHGRDRRNGQHGVQPPGSPLTPLDRGH